MRDDILIAQIVLSVEPTSRILRWSIDEGIILGDTRGPAPAVEVQAKMFSEAVESLRAEVCFHYRDKKLYLNGQYRHISIH